MITDWVFMLLEFVVLLLVIGQGITISMVVSGRKERREDSKATTLLLAQVSSELVMLAPILEKITEKLDTVWESSESRAQIQVDHDHMLGTLQAITESLERIESGKGN